MTENRLHALGALVTVTAVLVGAVFVSGASLSGTVATPGQSNSQPDPAESIDSCTTITEPGDYELAGDLDGAGEDVCLHVQASNVTIDGNGHTIAGSGAEDSFGLLVYAAEPTEPVDIEDALEDVTVRDVTAANWDRGIQIGGVDVVNTMATLEDVTTRDNDNAGVYLMGAADTDIDGLTTTNNGHGVILFEAHDSTVSGVDATGNGGAGVYMSGDVYRVTLEDVTATENGGDSDGLGSGGIYISTDVRDNVVTDVRLADNDGAGIQFSDSADNVVRNVVSESNDGPGIHSIPANGDVLQNVTTRDNGGLALGHSEGELSADGLDVDGVASVTFENEPVNLDPFDAGDVPSPPTGQVATERGLNVTNVDDSVEVTFDDVGGEQVELWRFDGTDWVQVSDSTHDSETGTVSGSVTADGLVVPVQTEDNGDDDGTTTTTDDMTTTTAGGTTTTDDTTTSDDTATTDTSTTETTAGDDASTLVVSSTRADHSFGYIFVVDGDVERSNSDGVAADDTDRIVDSGDGTVTVIGSTGDQSGDAYRVTGDITEFYTPATATDYVLKLDDEDVTDELPRPN